MAMFNLRLTPDDGETFDVEAGMRDVVMWEKTHRGRSLAALAGEGLSATMIYELAYSACRRQQLLPRDLPESLFVERYEIEVEEDDERAARLRAEALRDRIRDAELPGAEQPIIEPSTDEQGETDGPPPAPIDPFDGFTPRHDADPTRPEA